MPQLDGFQPIEWEDSMATGIDAIDKQHRYLVETIQAANKKLLANDDADLVSQVAKDLLGYAITHFDTEEALMQRYGYATARSEEAKAHIAEHRYFSSQVVAVCDQLREGQKVSRIDVLRFLNHWLRTHVLGTDQLLGKFLIRRMG